MPPHPSQQHAFCVRKKQATLQASPSYLCSLSVCTDLQFYLKEKGLWKRGAACVTSPRWTSWVPEQTCLMVFSLVAVHTTCTQNAGNRTFGSLKQNCDLSYIIQGFWKIKKLNMADTIFSPYPDSLWSGIWGSSCVHCVSAMATLFFLSCLKWGSCQ